MALFAAERLTPSALGKYVDNIKLNRSDTPVSAIRRRAAHAARAWAGIAPTAGGDARSSHKSPHYGQHMP